MGGGPVPPNRAAHNFTVYSGWDAAAGTYAQQNIYVAAPAAGRRGSPRGGWGSHPSLGPSLVTIRAIKLPAKIVHQYWQPHVCHTPGHQTGRHIGQEPPVSSRPSPTPFSGGGAAPIAVCF